VLSLSVERELPYTAEQLFDVAADIERYPEFLPWWQTASVLERDAGRCRVHNVVALGPLRLQFGSEALLLRPERIEVQSREAPFERLQLAWRFTPTPQGGCQLSLSVQIAMRSALMQLAVARTLNGVLSQILFAFQGRARALYGGAAPSE